MSRSLTVIGMAVAIVIIGVSGPVIAQVGSRSGNPGNEGLRIARAYLKGLEQGNLDDLDRLFLAGQRSSILENASDEGSWERYRDHHLAPEMKETSGFKFFVAKEAAERLGSTVVVRQVGKFSVKVGEEDRAYRVAITFVLVESSGDLKIAHLHWSSRASCCTCVTLVPERAVTYVSGQTRSEG